MTLPKPDPDDNDKTPWGRAARVLDTLNQSEIDVSIAGNHAKAKGVAGIVAVLLVIGLMAWLI